MQTKAILLALMLIGISGCTQYVRVPIPELPPVPYVEIDLNKIKAVYQCNNQDYTLHPEDPGCQLPIKTDMYMTDRETLKQMSLNFSKCIGRQRQWEAIQKKSQE